jgi:hypothetical protein
MAICGERNTHDRLRDIKPRHWQRPAAGCGAGAWQRMQAIVDCADAVLVGT